MPLAGERCWFKRFAILPVNINGSIVFLTHYWVLCEYRVEEDSETWITLQYATKKPPVKRYIGKYDRATGVDKKV